MNDMIPRITVRDHQDVHMLYAMLGDMIEHLEARHASGRGCSERLEQARSMYAELDDIHTAMVAEMESKLGPIGAFIQQLEDSGVEVTVIDLEDL